MPAVIEAGTCAPISLAEAVARLDALDPDFRDDGDIAQAARCLSALDANRTFLGDLIARELKTGHKEVPGENGYGPQAIMLSGARPGYFLRANIWPSPGESAFRSSGPESFVYGLPHDHNFDFLTVGHFGPGYGSDYYEYDYDTVAGISGENAGLRFAERSILSPGRMLHYRAHRDVHAQLPPTSLSVSLNIVAADPARSWCDQYRFDVRENRVAAIVNSGASEALLRCGIAMGHGETLDLAGRFARHHPCERLRLAVFDARSRMEVDADAVWREAELSGSRLVAGEARLRRQQLER